MTNTKRKSRPITAAPPKRLKVGLDHASRLAFSIPSMLLLVSLRRSTSTFVDT